MAKYECRLSGSFQEILNEIENGIMRGSMSASFEDGSDFRIGDISCAVRVYERYSMIGSNRVSLNITLIGTDDESRLSAIASGGSQAVFFKVNTLGEEAFLDCLVDIVERFHPDN